MRVARAARALVLRGEGVSASRGLDWAQAVDGALAVAAAELAALGPQGWVQLGCIAVVSWMGTRAITGGSAR